MTTTLHAHVDTESQDCDSRYTNSYLMWMDTSELEGEDAPNWFGEIVFRQRVLSHIVSAYTCVAGTLKVSGCPETGLTDALTWNESTEEGYRAADVRFCDDTFCADETSYRDHTAESMGY